MIRFEKKNIQGRFTYDSVFSLKIRREVGHFSSQDGWTLLSKSIFYSKYIWVLPKIGVPQNGWFIMETPIKKG